MTRIGRRTRRISDSKTLNSRLQNRKRVVDADDDDNDDLEIGDLNLTQDEIQGLLELLPYKEALIKIAKGEFEIERVEEADEDEEVAGTEETDTDTNSEAEEENFEEDEDFSENDEDEEDYEEEDDTEVVEDSAVVDAWSKRLKGNNK